VNRLYGQEGDSQARACAIFKQGVALVKAGQLEAGLLRFEAALQLFRAASDRLGEGSTLSSIGRVYEDLRKDEQALTSYQQALAIFQEIGNQPMVGTILHVIGLVCDNLGRLEQALDSYQQALAIAREIGDREGEGRTLRNLVRVYLQLGQVYQALGQYRQALDYLEQALAIAREIGDQEKEGTTLNNIGQVYEAQGEYHWALNCYRQALAIQQEIGDRLGEGSTLNNMGVIYQTLGEYQQALENLQQSLAIHRDINYRAKQGRTFYNIGLVYNVLGQDEQALSYYQQALTMMRESGDREGEGAAFCYIGMLYGLQGQHQQALDYHQQALSIFQEIGNRAWEGKLFAGIGADYKRMGQYQQARESLQQALKISQEIGDQGGEAGTLFLLGESERNLDYLQQALGIFQEIGDQGGEWQTLARIGFLYEIQGDTARAIDFYKQAIEVKEDIQGNLKIEELKLSFAEQIDVYECLIGLLCSQRRDQDMREAFRYMERSRARAFLDQVANNPLDFRTGADPKLLQQEETLKAQITALRTQLSNLLKQEGSLKHQIRTLHTQLVQLRSHPSNQLDTEAIAAVQKQLDACEKEYSQLLTQLKLTSPEVASLVSVDVATLQEIQGLLDPDTTLVEYFVTEGIILVYIITHRAFVVFPLDLRREDLTKKIEAFRRFTNLKNPHPKSLQQLHEWLITPLKKYLTTSHLTIVPHGILHYLPFAALTDGQRYLCDDYTIITLPCASVLRFLPEKRKPSTGTLLALGNPTTTEPLPALHYAQQEAHTIAQLYNTEALVGAAATQTALFSKARSAEILHIAAHGKYNRHNPLFSTLYLAPDDQDDGRLEVHDIYTLDLTLATNLVVLSACQTQLGELSKGDEVVGLTRAFLYAGTPSVMASLWSVDDKVTGLLMERFYTYLRSGMTKAQALRMAQMEVRAEYPHPYYWAAFVLTGDGAEMTNNFQTVRADDVLLDEQKAPHEALVAELKLMIRARYPLLYIVTAEEEPVEAVFAQLAAQSQPQRQVLIWDIVRGWNDNGSDKGSVMGALNRIGKADSQKAIIFVLRDLHPILRNPYTDKNSPVVRELRNLARELKRNRQTLILTSHELELPSELREETTVIDFPLPDVSEINYVISQLVVPEKLKVSGLLREQLVKACQGLSRARIQRVLAKALAAKQQVDETDIDGVLEAKKQAIRQTGILEFFTTRESLKNIGGLENLKQWVRMRQNSFTEAARRYGIPSPKGVLLVGIQGTGKSLSAKTIAHEWRLPLLRLDSGRLFGGIIGESESRVRQMIQLAEAMAPCVLWIDEIDKAFGNITSGFDGDSGTSRRVFSSLITWMQEKTASVFIVATANNVRILPAELLRKGRFDEIFFLNLPTEAERREIFKVHLQRLRPSRLRNFDVALLAKKAENLSGAEIEQVIVDAMHRAFNCGNNGQQRDFTTEDIYQAISETVPLAAIAREQIESLKHWAAEVGAKTASDDARLVKELEEYILEQQLRPLEID
jgi:CHAT domain-containing protein/SpoVK/Ycf46/Vps4 family AAA+-type ATPase/Tfp pilus assembly protein PilF